MFDVLSVLLGRGVKFDSRIYCASLGKRLRVNTSNLSISMIPHQNPRRQCRVPLKMAAATAAAWLKAEAQGVSFALVFVRMMNDNCRYDAAEHGAHRALVLDPLSS
jgi:hypothetical protein